MAALTLVPAPGGALPDARVSVVNFAFVPATVTVQLHGLTTDMVIWTNNSPSNHQPHDNPHGQNGQADCFEGGVVGPGQTRGLRISATCAVLNNFVVRYHCHIHPGMAGTINIRLA